MTETTAVTMFEKVMNPSVGKRWYGMVSAGAARSIRQSACTAALHLEMLYFAKKYTEI